MGHCPGSCQLVGENAGFMQSRPCEAVLVLWVDVLEVVSWWESTGFTQSRPCEGVVGRCSGSCLLVGESVGFMQSIFCEAVVLLAAVLKVVS